MPKPYRRRESSESEDYDDKEEKEKVKTAFKKEISGVKSFVSGFKLGSFITNIIILFITYLILNSDIFIEQVFSKDPTFVSGGIVSSKGTLIQAFLLVMVYLLVNIMIEVEIF